MSLVIALYEFGTAVFVVNLLQLVTELNWKSGLQIGAIKHVHI